MKLQLALFLAVLGWIQQGRAAPMFFTNETAFRDALTALGYSWSVEGFEGPEWEASRDPGTTADVLSQGVGWYAESRMTTRWGTWTRTGSYGVFDTTSTWGDGQAAPNDHLYAYALDLTAIGGWFQGTGTLRVYGPQSELAGTLALGGPFRFAGVLDPTGLPSVEFAGGQFGADDFTIALVRPPPAPPKVSLVEFSSSRGAVLFIQGQRGRTNVIEASADLAVWTPIGTNVMPLAVCPICPNAYFSDVAGTNSPRRFYRAFEVP